MEILNKDKITSLELLEQINLFRKQEGRRKTTHKDLLIIIETELIGINRKRIEGGVCPEMQKQIETDAIKTLLEYGKVPKNKHSRYYTNYSRLPYVVLGIDKVDRDVLPAYDLEQIKEMETIIQLTIYKSIMELKPIKEIYNICKNKLINSLVQN